MTSMVPKIATRSEFGATLADGLRLRLTKK